MKLFLFLLFLWITVVVGRIDGRHDVFDSSEDSTSSEEMTGRAVNRDSFEDSEGSEGSSEKSEKKGKSCPGEWMSFDRSQGKWCVKVFMSNGNFLSAETLCRSYNSTLTGFQTNDERLKIADVAKQMIQSRGIEVALMWIGARRKSNCPTAGMCFADETFYWTDNFTKVKEAFEFSSGQPDASLNNRHNQNWGHESCLQQMIFASGTTHPKYASFQGQLNDLHCQNPEVQMCACGRRP
uniref:C-type lectin domain-containing protein n=1 Tax=Caenorhabditis tropicalis TaxID=1561998 RepID=A0A1I7TF43_9PELO